MQYSCPKCGKPLRPRSKSAGGKVRWECRTAAGVSRSSGGGAETYCYSTANPEALISQKGNNTGRPRAFKRELRETSVYIITAAQNATPIHEVFWACLKQAAKHRGAELLVVPIRYKNPTSRWSASQANAETWAAEVGPYLWNQRKALNDNLTLLGDVKTQPTASRPLTGFEGMTQGSSTILGHTKLQLKVVPSPGRRTPKVMTTTGACTVANYTDSRAGKVGAFHHALAACIVEIEGGAFYLRQLNFDTKTQSFTDLGTRYYEDRYEKAPRPLALVMGDTHVDMVSPEVEAATWGAGGIVPTLKPERIVWHDLLDGYSVNPHHAGNPFNKLAKMRGGLSDVRAEVERACRYVKSHTPDGTTSVIVPSNHDDFLRRWIVNHDWKHDPGNMEFYLETSLEMARATKLRKGFGTVTPSPLAMLFPKIVDVSNIEVLDGSRSYAVGGVELSMHGNRGPNGERGSIMNHRRLGVRTIIGHSHVPGIDEGCYQVGTSTNLTLEYTEGAPSSWLNAHCLLGADGKRQIIVIDSGSWRAA